MPFPRIRFRKPAAVPNRLEVPTHNGTRSPLMRPASRSRVSSLKSFRPFGKAIPSMKNINSKADHDRTFNACSAPRLVESLILHPQILTPPTSYDSMHCVACGLWGGDVVRIREIVTRSVTKFTQLFHTLDSAPCSLEQLRKDGARREHQYAEGVSTNPLPSLTITHAWQVQSMWFLGARSA